MKRYYVVFTMAVLVSLFTIDACQNPYENVDLKVDLSDLQLDSPKKTVVLEFPGLVEQGLSASDVHISLIGDDATNMFNVETDTNSFTINQYGIATLSVTEDNVVSNDGLSFFVSVTAKGYLPVLKYITITESDEVVPLTIFLAKYDEAPVGVIANETTFTTSTDGSIPGLIEIVPERQAGNAQRATISIPEGTRLLDANGEVVSGTISSEFIFYNPALPGGAENFPGDFVVEEAEDENGNVIDPGFFISAGMISLEMENENNTAVKSFSTPIEVEVEISEDITTDTGEKIKVGDQIPVWSQDKGTLKWKREGFAEVVLNNEGKLSTTMVVTHLSYWNLDFHRARCSNSRRSVTLTFALSQDLPQGETYQLKIINNDYGYWFKSTRIRLENETVQRFLNMPPGNTRLEFYYNGVLFHEVSSVNLCAGNQTINVTNSKSVKIPEKITLKINAICPNNGNISVNPRANVYIKKYVTSYYGYRYLYYQYIGTLYSGVFSTQKLVLGETYDFVVEGYVGWRYVGYMEFKATVPNTNYIEKTISIPAKYANRVCE